MSNLIVETRYGKVQGSKQGSISVWKGIPFAQHPSAMIAQGSAANVAILAGTNRDEWRLFALMKGSYKIL
jgi:para-nitrobenzyl esterase